MDVALTASKEVTALAVRHGVKAGVSLKGTADPIVIKVREVLDERLAELLALLRWAAFPSFIRTWNPKVFNSILELSP